MFLNVCIVGKAVGQGQGQGLAQTAAASAANGVDEDKGDEDEKEVNICTFILCWSYLSSDVVSLVCNGLATVRDLPEERQRRLWYVSPLQASASFPTFIITNLLSGFHLFCIYPRCSPSPRVNGSRNRLFCTGGDFGFDEGEEYSLSFQARTLAFR